MNYPALRTREIAIDEPTPPIFCEGNRPFWIIVRRLLIAMLKELDKAYGWETFGK